MSTRAKNILIVGADAGGLPLAGWLGRRYRKHPNVTVTLVDRSLSHVWKPLLHEYAVGTLTSNDDEINLFAHSQQWGYEFVFGAMEAIDRDAKQVQLAAHIDADGAEVLPTRRVDYDVLVIATGSTCSDFGIDGVAENTIKLDDKPAAENFHREFIHYLLRGESREAHKEADELRQRSIVIVGAGATGVELAAQIQEVINNIRNFGLRHYPREDTRVILLEAAERCVPGLGTNISNRVAETLDRMGVDLRTGKQVARMGKHSIEIEGEAAIAADLIVWAAGIEAYSWQEGLDLETNGKHQIRVERSLQSTTDPNIFAMGDCAGIEYESGDGTVTVPPLAQAAFQQAQYLRRAIPQWLNEGDITMPFTFRQRGSLVTVASEDASGNIMGKYIQSLGIYGLLARIAYLSLYRRHQLAVLGPWQTLAALVRNALSASPGSRLKLH